MDTQPGQIVVSPQFAVTVLTYIFQLLTESLQIQNFYRLSAFLTWAIGDSPIPTRVAQLIVKTVPALIYRNELLITIKVIIKRLKR
jgi:hypothetical protein